MNKKSSRFKATIKEFEEASIRLELELQQLAVFSLQQAKCNELTYANKLLSTLIEEGWLEVSGLLISWFEKFGSLKWSNKKKYLVNSASGKWLIEKAKYTPWSESENLSTRLGTIQYDYDYNVSRYFDNKKLVEDKKIIYDYLKNNPVDASSIGKFGLPGDKNRWGKYKLKIKRR